jgi:thiol-disulfide isomerase/thioredoxin
MSWRAALLLLAATTVQAAASSSLPLRAFAELDALAAERELVVIFFRSTATGAAATRKEELEAAAGQHAARFEIVGCDVALAANAARAKEAGLRGRLPRVFVVTRDDGIEPFKGDAAGLGRHLELKARAADPRDVVEFRDVERLYALIDAPKAGEGALPLFVMFYEPWCTHCAQSAATFARGATMFKERVRFVRAHCSVDADAKAFCRANAIRALPTLLLFTGEEKVRYGAERPRTLPEFASFFDEHAARFPAQIGYARAGAGVASAPRRDGGARGGAGARSVEVGADGNVVSGAAAPSK